MELGTHSAEGHRLARDVAQECGVECWVVGTQFAEHAPGDRTYADVDALIAEIQEEAVQNRTILLKGSRSMKLETLGSPSLKRFTAPRHVPLHPWISSRN